ncbi:MAG: tail fiber domain-containing protein [Patescibacteria group bacterium]|nr:tail fiber domain-containing protein [Patescibacteria group bacterium]
MKKQIFSSKIIYFSIFLILICFSYWGVEKVRAADPLDNDQIDMLKYLDMNEHGIFNLATPVDDDNAATQGYVKSVVLTNTGWTATDSYIYLTTIGNSVGIGTTIPVAKLEVANNYSSTATLPSANIGIVGRNYTGSGADVIGVYGQGKTNDASYNSYGGYFYGTYSSNRNKAIGIYAYGNDYAAILDGTVGIGSSIPATKLDVNGNIAANTYYSRGDPIGYFLNPAAGGTGWGLYSNGSVYASGSDDNYFAGSVGIGITNPGAKLSIVTPDTNYSTIWSNNGGANNEYLSLYQTVDDFIFTSNKNGSGVRKGIGITATGADNTMPSGIYLKTDGYVGIGTTIPGFNLDVYGSGVVASQIVSTNNYSAQYIKGGQSGDVRWGLFSGYPNVGDFTIRETGVADYLTVKKTTGNVGIGTTIPGMVLTVNTSTNDQGIQIQGAASNISPVLKFATSAGTAYARIGIAGAAGNLATNSGQNDLVIRTEGTQKLHLAPGAVITETLLSTGYVGIGTTIPSTNLDVNGQIKIRGGVPGAGKILISDAVGLATWSPATSISDGDWTISGNNQYSAVSGNVGIGTTDPTAILQINKSTGGSGQKWLILSTTGASSEGMVFRTDNGDINRITSYGDLYLESNNGSGATLGLDSGGHSGFGGYVYAPSLTVGGLDITPPTEGAIISGNVGIGVTDPVSKLAILSGAGVGGISIGTDETYAAVAAPDGGAIIEGNVGIGYTTASIDKLRVNGSIMSTGPAGGSPLLTSAIRMSVEGSGAYGQVQTYNSVPLVLNPTTAGGNVGIGVTNPGNKLSVYGGTIGAYNFDGTDGLLIEGYSASASDDAMMQFHTSGALYKMGIDYSDEGKFKLTYGSEDNGQTQIVMTGSGKVGIGLANHTPLSKLDVSGNMAIGSYAGASAAPSNSLIVSGNIGIGTTAPGIDLAIGDTDTGLDWASDGNLKVMTNNSERIRIASDGKVGIGTTGPVNPLHIYSSSSSVIPLRVDDYYYTYSIGAGTFSSPNTNGWQLYKASSETYYDSVVGGHHFLTSGSEKVTFTSDGKLGIGTATPATYLDIKGTQVAGSYGDAATAIKINMTNDASSIYGGIAWKDSETAAETCGIYPMRSGGVNYFDFLNTGTVYMRLLGGTGTILNDNSADLDFRVESNDNANMFFVDGGANTVTVGYNGSLGSKFNVYSATNNTTQFTGHLLNVRAGDGTTNTISEIDFGVANTVAPVIIGSKVIDGSGATKGDFYIGTRDSTDGATLPTERLRVTTAGKVGIGITNPGQALDVTGTIRQSACKTAGTLSANTSGDIICTSDERLKNIYGYYQGGLAALSAINPIKFSYKGEDFVHVGFSAQNVKSVLPEASALQDSGYWSLDDTSITALTVNAIKEQQKEIEDLKNVVCQLKPDADVCNK